MLFNASTLMVILSSTIFIVIIKMLLLFYIKKAITDRKRQSMEAGNAFLIAIFVFIFSLFASRMFYMVFDFYYTQFDTTLYYTHPAVYFWQIGQFIAGCGEAYCVYIIDKKIINNKFHGVFAYTIFAGALLQLLYPINDMVDFNFVSGLSIITSIGTLLIPLIFIHIARESLGDVRTNAIYFTIGIILYAVGAIVVNAGFIDFLKTMTHIDWTIFMYIFQSIVKSMGIIILSKSSVQFQIRKL